MEQDSKTLLRSMSSASVGSASDGASSTTTTANTPTPPPQSHHPLSNFTAPHSTYLMYTPLELAELAGTSLEALNDPPLLTYFNAILPALQYVPAGPDYSPENIPRPPCDISLITNFTVFKVCLAHVLKYSVRAIPPPSSSQQQQQQLQSQGAAWSVLGGVIGNWHAIVGSGWKRRLGPGGFEISGPRGGGCGLYGWEEVLGRLLVDHQEFRRPPANSSNHHHRSASSSSSFSSTDNDCESEYWNQQALEDLECRNAWMKRSPLPSSGFITIMPLIDFFDRRSRPYDLEVEDEMRNRRLTMQQRSQYIHNRTDVRVEYIPSGTFLVSSDGEDPIRLENEDDLNLVDAPPGYTLQTVPAGFNIYQNLTHMFPKQRLTISTGNLSNHHLMLSYGTSEERNMCDIIDIPIDLIEDAVTCYLEHFGPTTRPLYSTNIHSSTSPFNIAVDLKTRYQTASERNEAMRGKGKGRARYDVATYERGRRLLKALGLFPKEGGIIRCKAEYFWQEEAFSTILQVLLMSSDQLTEYSLEPCLLGYNCMLPQQNSNGDSPKSKTLDTLPERGDETTATTTTTQARDYPPPRPNMIPTHKSRNRGPLPHREGCLDAFLVVSCGVLKRRLLMYPTTYLEDVHLVQRMNEAYYAWRDQMNAAHHAAAAAGAGGGKSVFPAQNAATSTPVVATPTVNTAAAAAAAAAREDGGDVDEVQLQEHEEKRRRKGNEENHYHNNATDGLVGSDKSSPDTRSGGGARGRGEGGDEMKVARSDETLVSDMSGVQGSDASNQQQSQPEQPPQNQQSEFSFAVPHILVSQPAVHQQSQQQQHPQQPQHPQQQQQQQQQRQQ
ncbi:hypothetical protein BDR26DRAFT_868357, partial [Obelidium mucronatum]